MPRKHLQHLAALLIAVPIICCSETSAADPVVPTYESVVPARDFVGREIAELPGQLGEVADLLIDLETSQVVAAIFRQNNVDGPSAVLTLPIVALRQTQEGHHLQPWVTEAMIQQLAPTTATKQSFTRGRVSDQYRAFDREPYWGEFLKRRQKIRVVQRFDQTDFLLSRYSELVGSPIMDAENSQVGTIEEVVVVPETFAVAYLLVETMADRYQAIPLGAFKVNEQGRWQINLDRESIHARPTVDRSELPLSIDRGWVE